MALALGSRLGSYEILALLGAGGMGEVYRVRDSKLGREVAIKVLPAAVAQDPDKLARFRREASLLAALNHPNIATIHGLEEEQGAPFLVLELIEGEDLAERAKRGPIPIQEALDIARQIAAALEEAHEQGIVHRDLKPGNVKITPDGRVKVLDFGLAKALAAETPGGDVSPSPTPSAQETQVGAILGTAAYMSPEQAAGRPVDGRADIWALGVVLFEMLTGRPFFTGATASEVLASVIKDEPDWSSLPASTGPMIGGLLRLCLTKDPRRRLRHVGDARLLLGEAMTADAGASGSPASAAGLAWKRAVPIGLAIFLLGGAVAKFTGTPAAEPAGASLGTWDARPLTATGDAWNVTLAPDGETVAYLTAEGLTTQDVQRGSPNLILRDPDWGLGSREHRPGRPRGEPQWLHDGSGVAFTLFVDPTTLGVSSVPRMGGRTAPQLVTSFTGGEVEASIQSLPGDAFLLARVLENREAAPWIRWMDGEAEQRIDVPLEIVSLWDAVASPDGKWIAYIGERADRSNVVATVSRDGSRHNVIAERGPELSKWAELSTNRQWAGNRIMRWPAGNRVYYRQLSSRGVDVYAIPIDSGSGRASADPELVYSGLPPAATFDVALEGRRLVYSGGPVKTQVRLFRFDLGRGGEPVSDRTITRGTARHVAPRFSPDGQQLAYIRKTGRSEDIYIVPVAGGEARPLNVLYRWNQLIDLRWSPDGEELAVYALTAKGSQLLIVSLSDSRVREVPTRPLSSTSFEWSPDGRWIAYPTKGDYDYVLHELATGVEREIFGELQGEKIQSIFSADGGELLVNNIGLAQPGLWALDLVRGPSRLVTPDYSLRTYPVLWTPEGTIHLLSPRGEVLAVDAATGASRPIGRLPEAPIWEGWASMRIEDGSLYLACAIDEPRESDVWVLERVGS